MYTVHIPEYIWKAGSQKHFFRTLSMHFDKMWEKCIFQIGQAYLCIFILPEYIELCITDHSVARHSTEMCNILSQFALMLKQLWCIAGPRPTQVILESNN